VPPAEVDTAWAALGAGSTRDPFLAETTVRSGTSDVVIMARDLLPTEASEPCADHWRGMG
jgi:hypothetical protein